jgi:hypothetical protein
VITALVAAAALVGPVGPTPEHPIVIGAERISRGTLRHWADIAQRSAGGGPRAAFREQAAELVIGYRWIRGEAVERGIVVTRSEVTRTFRRQRDETFPRRRDFRRYLRRTGQSIADIRFRVRSTLLSDKLRELATEGATTPAQQQEQLDAFVRDYHAKWRARTACRPPWVVRRRCGAN